MSQHKPSGEEKEKKWRVVLPTLTNPYLSTPILPDAFSIGILRLGKSGYCFVTLRFAKREGELIIPLGTYILTKDMAKDLLEAISRALEELENVEKGKEEEVSGKT